VVFLSFPEEYDISTSGLTVSVNTTYLGNRYVRITAGTGTITWAVA
jgi:hypothetical protein